MTSASDGEVIASCLPSKPSDGRLQHGHNLFVFESPISFPTHATLCINKPLFLEDLLNMVTVTGILRWHVRKQPD